ncbi:MAG: lipocalin family protein [Candidatus Kapaibacterium sp.]
MMTSLPTASSITLLVLMTLLAAACSTTHAPLQTVASVDLDRYAGTWYEVARLPNSFQTKCSCNVTATYVVNDDGTVEVINRCMKQDGSITESRGNAEVVDTRSRSKLRVTFLPGFLRWLGIGWGDYWIIDLDDAYTTAAVAAPSRSYLWILSRSGSIDDATRARLLTSLKDKGFATDELLWTKQTGR